MAAKASSLEWEKALDLDQAASNVAIDVRGDWYRDPWGWPEIEWALKERRDFFVSRLKSSGVCGAVPIDVPKENFGIRPALVMDPIDRTIYQALVDRCSGRLIGQQPAWVHGWRLPAKEFISGQYARNDHQWTGFLANLRALAGAFGAALKTDIVSFFASVDLSALADVIADRSGSGMPEERVTDLLQGWARVPMRGGLPQRSLASAILANAYLNPVDDLLAYRGAIPGWASIPVVAASRWMDDIWLFNKDPGFLRQAQVELQQVLRSLGLNMNLGKTDVLEGKDLEEAVGLIDHSGVDEGLNADPADSVPLDDLIDRLLCRPEHASRTSIRFATTRMREHNRFERVGAFVAKAHQMPHAHDHLARLFRSSGEWRNLADWFVEHCQRSWAVVPWGTAQLGTMFPASQQVGERLRNHLAMTLATGKAALPLAVLASQRLSCWEPPKARAAIRAAAESAREPHIRRALAISALQASEERKFIRDLLREFRENEVTLTMIEARHFRPLKSVTDFSGT